jgi:FMN phosphatase YigB (HAD superfamily)
MFQAALHVLAQPAHQVLHVGDDWAADVLGADAAGLSAAWIAHAHAGWPPHAQAELQARVLKVADVPALQAWLAGSTH